ncbi:hypothetical protein CMV_011756 [Castanea mollissima]|uniref:Uncharacterized protein n=1 Tax=Castanea mollissima TaxID=60419 RepID=A0A8J4VWP2_9ROSI|nr:hypothetical protein CMV_011756 [Castanea mollissima]
MPHSSGKVLMEYGSGICPLQASHARLCSWHYAYLDDKFFTREDAGLIRKVLMEYASGIFLGPALQLALCIPVKEVLVLIMFNQPVVYECFYSSSLGFIALYANFDEDLCLIPKSPFYLEGAGGEFGNNLLHDITFES